MARLVSATAGAAMVAATLVLPAAGVAYASGNGDVTGNGNVSVLSGNTINAPVSVPVNLCGVSLGIIGFANSGCAGGASSNVSTDPSGGGGNGNVVGDGNVGLGSGNTVTAPVSAPVNVCGVSGAVGGFANSDCHGGANSDVTLPSSGSDGGNGNVTGVGNVSGASGNTITAPVSAPVNLCSLSLALLGFSNSGCEGGATTDVSGAAPGNNGNVTGVGNVSGASGNTITAPISAPVNVCGISTAVAGLANSGCQGSAAVDPANDTAANGTAANGPAANGTAVNGPAVKGPAVNGNAANGPAVNGPAVNGTAANGPAADSTAANGAALNGTAANGTAANVTAANRTPLNGTAVNGAALNGTPRGGDPAGGTTAAMPDGSLPTTGADLLLLGITAVGTIGVSAAAVTLGRRRRSGPAA